MDEIKRDRGHLFWSEWEAVTKRTRNLLKRRTGHCIMLTADPKLLKDSQVHQRWKDRHKKAAPTAPTAETAKKVEPVQKFPPLIIP